MKRKLKKIFSRFSLVGLTIILIFMAVVAVIVGGFYLADAVVIYYYPETRPYIEIGVAVLDWLILVLTVLHAANRDMVPETKVPWLICIIVFNIVGVIAYFTFSSHRPTKKQRARYLSLIERSIPYSKRKFTKQETENLLGSWADGRNRRRPAAMR